jgi:hypothetical protein
MALEHSARHLRLIWKPNRVASQMPRLYFRSNEMSETDLNQDGATTDDDLEQAILESAIEGISSVTSDGVTVTQQKLEERQRVLDRRRNATSATLAHFGMRHTKLVSQGGGQ